MPKNFSESGSVSGKAPQPMMVVVTGIWVADENTARTAASGDAKCLLHDPRKISDIGDEITVLHDGQGDAKDIRFLKRAFADHGLRDLASDGDERNGIHVGIGDPGDQVRRARPAGGHANARFAAGPGVTLSGKGPSLLVARKDRSDFRAGEGLMEFHAGAARI